MITKTTRESNPGLKPNSVMTPSRTKNGQPIDNLKSKRGLSNRSANQGGPSKHLKPIVALAPLCSELQALQRQRVIYIKSRIMVANRLQALVAGTIGYHSGMNEKDRRKVFSEAGSLIKQIEKGEIASLLHGLVLTHLAGIREFERVQGEIEKSMVKLAKQLPVVSWVQTKEQRGFGVLFLAIVIGETGDLFDYANPGKVWRRLGCAPWTFDGQTRMGATWKGGKEGKLPASEWESFGYSPRRRSIAYLIGEGMVKQNFVTGNGELEAETELQGASPSYKKVVGAGDRSDETDIAFAGPYRLRYDETKVLFKQNHPDYSPLRCHRHGMLLATKLLLKNLWIEWRV